MKASAVRVGQTQLPAAAGTGLLVPDLGGSIQLGTGRPLRLEVQERLRNAIMDVRILPGTALSENELAGLLQVSRTPIREALQALALEGLIQVVPQVGTFVARLDLERIQEALFVREAVECAALARLPRRLKAADIKSLEQCISLQRTSARKGYLPGVFEGDTMFHRRLLELAGVPGVWRHVQEARELHRRVRVLAQVQSDAPQRSLQQHEAIVTEIAAGRPERAGEILREHIQMNLRFAQEMAQQHPNYFLAPQSTEAIKFA